MANLADNGNEIRNSGEKYLKGAVENVKETAKAGKDKAVDIKDKAVDYVAENPWKCVATGFAIAIAAGGLIKLCKNSKK